MIVKNFGERHTGTNVIKFIVNNNFNARYAHYKVLGFKHRIAPSEEELSKYDINNILFIITVRNPYDWITRMKKQPYAFQWPAIKNLPMSEFLKVPFPEDYENIIKMWNAKYDSYLKLMEKVPHSFLFTQEDIALKPETIFKKIGKKLNSKSNEYIFPENHMTGHGEKGSFNKSYFEKKSYIEPIKPYLDIINKQLDTKLTEKLGYEIIT